MKKIDMRTKAGKRLKAKLAVVREALEAPAPEGGTGMHGTYVPMSFDNASSRQEGGSHYKMSIEPWDAMQAWGSKEEFTGYLRFNALKYTSRMGHKEGAPAIDDARKAHHYLEKLIEVLNGK